MTARFAMVASVCVTTLSAVVLAQAPAPRMLPLDNLGLEHLDIVVPDVAASARFYARVFKTTLHQQPVRDTLRYFVLLAKVYQRDGFAGALQAAGLPSVPTGAGGLGMWPDPDGLELQLFQPPAGLVTAAVKGRTSP